MGSEGKCRERNDIGLVGERRMNSQSLREF